MPKITVNEKGFMERREAILGELQQLVDTINTETRAFNEEEQGKYNSLMTELKGIDEMLKVADETRSLESLTPVKQTEQKTREYLETRAAVNMTTGDNGAVIPSSIANKIIETVKEISPLYARATHYNVGGTLTIPRYDEATQKITMAYATEFSALVSSSGKFTSISLSGFLAGALCKVSISLVNNSQFDIVSYVIRKMAEAVAGWVEGQLISGTSGKITGLSDVAASVTAASATAVTSDELIDLQEAVPDKLQPGCIWLMSRATRKAIRKLKDGDGNYLLNKDATAKWGYSLFGHDVYVSDNMPDMSAGKAAIFYLDPRGLAVKISENANIQVLRERFADEHAIGVITWVELDSKVENTQMIAKLVMKAT